MRWALRPAFSSPSFINLTVRTHVSGSKWQFTPTMSAPAHEHMHIQHIQIVRLKHGVKTCRFEVPHRRRRCTSFDQPDSTLSRWDPLHVSVRGDAQCCTHWFPAGLQHLHCPHCLFDVIKELQKKQAVTEKHRTFTNESHVFGQDVQEKKITFVLVQIWSPPTHGPSGS